ncbi:MAG: hypothetical protein ACXV4B_06400 [Halobacteriota archaeon]
MQRERSPYELETIRTIQHVRARMATNSLIIKGWVVAVLGIVVLLGSTRYQALIAVFALLVFWYLDAYFQRQKKAYGALYNEIVENKLNIGDEFFDMKTAWYEVGIEVPRAGKLMLSKTLLIFYGSLLTLTCAYVGILFVLPYVG